MMLQIWIIRSSVYVRIGYVGKPGLGMTEFVTNPLGLDLWCLHSAPPGCSSTSPLVEQYLVHKKKCGRELVWCYSATKAVDGKGQRTIKSHPLSTYGSSSVALLPQHDSHITTSTMLACIFAFAVHPCTCWVGIPATPLALPCPCDVVSCRG